MDRDVLRRRVLEPKCCGERRGLWLGSLASQICGHAVAGFRVC